MSNPPEMVRRRDLSEHDIAVWDGFVRHVKAFPGRRVPAPAAAAAMVALPIGRTEAIEAPPRTIGLRQAPIIVGEQPPGVDNATWRRLRSGRLPAQRSLDLHGHTAQRAYLALDQLLRSARSDGVRVVEVITGRGAGESGGVLRRELPLWLNQPQLRSLVLAAAHPHARNTGAVRLLLRRSA